MSNYTVENLIPVTTPGHGTPAIRIGDQVFPLGGAEVTLGAVDSQHRFQPLSFSGTTPTASGSPEVVTNFKSWLSPYPAPPAPASIYRCASVDTVNHTWTGYKAVLSGGVYTFESTATTGLTYTVVTPEVGKIYSSDALVLVENVWQGIPFAGLIRYAPLSASAAVDEQGYGLTTVQTVTFGTDSGIPCASFPEDDPGYIGYTSSVPTLTAWTMSVWAKPIPNTDTAIVTLSNGNYGVGGGEIWLLDKADGTVMVVNGAASDNIITETTGVSVGWHHCAIVWTGSVFRLYIDGTQQGSDASTVYSASGAYLYVNSLQRATGAVHGQGKYAALRLYDRALTALEITALAGEFTPSA